MIGAVTIVIIVFGMMMCLHNIDNAWNMRTTQLVYGDKWCDWNELHTNCADPTTIYSNSIAWLLYFIILNAVIAIITITYPTNESIAENEAKRT